MTQTHGSLLLLCDDPQMVTAIRPALEAGGWAVMVVSGPAALLETARRGAARLALVGARDPEQGLAWLEKCAQNLPNLPLIALAPAWSVAHCRQAARSGALEMLSAPFPPAETLSAVRAALELASRRSAGWQQQAGAVEGLHQQGRQIAAVLEEDQVVRRILEAAVKNTGAAHVRLLFNNPVTGALEPRAAWPEQEAGAAETILRDAQRALRSGQITLSEGEPGTENVTRLCLPLVLQGRTLGVICLQSDRGGLTRRHAALLQTLAPYMALALENARRFSRLEADRGLLQSVLEGLPDGLIAADDDRRLVLTNSAARAAFGIPAHESLSGRPLGDVFIAEELERLFRLPAETLPAAAEIALGEGERVLDVLAAPPAGPLRVVTMRDVTTRKKLERIRADFVHTISHDLRSPLTAILGYAELVERAGPVTAMQGDFLRRIQGGVRSITALVDDLLHLGRIESGFDVRKEWVNFAQPVREAVEGLRKAAAERSLALSLALEDDLPALLASPLQLRQMIEQLVDNAIKYSAAGSVVRLSARTEQNQIILQVANEGMGIPVEELPFIFDRFYRASNAAAEMPGTGLGLSIVKSVVESHAGRIWVESAVGQGAVFTVVLPLPSA